MNNATTSITKKNLRWLPLWLAALIALAPFSIDSYLPAIGHIATALNTQVTQVQHSISSFFLGLAIGQLLGGPLSDRWGRRPIGTIGLLIYLITTSAILFTTNVEQLVMLRFFQALGGGFTMVIVGAMVRDLYNGREAAKIFSIISSIVLLAPLVAPAAGSALLVAVGWRGIFIFLLIYACAMLIVVRWLLPETVSRSTRIGRQGVSLRSLFKDYRKILANHRSLGLLLTQSLITGSLFIYITTAPFVFIEHFKISAGQFPLFFCIGVLGFICMTRLNLRLLNFFSPRKILLVGIYIQLLGCVLLLCTTLLNDQSLTLWMVPLTIVIACAGITTPNVLACYLEFFPGLSGSAYALFGTARFAVGGILGAIVTGLHTGTLALIASIMLICTITALLIALLLAQIRRPI